MWSGEGLFIGIFEAQNLGGRKDTSAPDLKPGGGRSPLLPPPVSYAYGRRPAGLECTASRLLRVCICIELREVAVTKGKEIRVEGLREERERRRIRNAEQCLVRHSTATGYAVLAVLYFRSVSPAAFRRIAAGHTLQCRLISEHKKLKCLLVLQN